MKQNYVIVGDIHLNSICNSRKDDYKETLFRKLLWVCKTANKLKAPILSVGDLLNEKPNEHNTPTETFQNFVNLIQKNLHGEFYICNIGNHDIKSNVSNWTKERIAWLNFVNKKFKIHPNIQFSHSGHESIYGVSFKEKIEYKADILITHDDWWVEDAKAGGKVIARAYDVQEARHPQIWINGHIHHGHPPLKIGKTVCINPGAVMRTVRNGIDDLRAIEIAVIQFTDGKLSKYAHKGIPHSVHTNVFHEKNYKPKIENLKWYSELTDKLKESKNKIKGGETPEKMIFRMHKEGLIEKPIAQKAIKRLM